MQHQRGNFLLQAMLALGVVFSFVPFLSRRLSDSNNDSRMYSATRQVETAQTAARIFIRENVNNLPYDTTVISGNEFADVLEPYGLPLGFVPRTPLGQDIVLIINKTHVAVSAYLELSGGKLTALQRAELVRRIGFYAAQSDDIIQVGVELQDVYSDVVRRNDANLDNSGFLTDLDMGGFVFDNAGNVFVSRANFDSAQFNTLSVVGTEFGKKERNFIESISATKTVFQSTTGESALTLVKGTLYADSLSTKTISMFGDAGNFITGDASVYEFAMTAGQTSFTGPGEWNVRGQVDADNINFSVERLDISSFVNATAGQNVFIDEDTLEYNTKTGLETSVLLTSNVTVRDQTSGALNDGKTGAVILDIRPAGTTMLPDALVSDVNNDSFDIIENPYADDAKTIGCETVIKKLDGVYNKQSLSQYLICQYVYWQRLEQRINVKQCLMAGRSDCI